MKRHTTTTIGLGAFLAMLLFVATSSRAEQALRYNSAEGTTVRVAGTSTVHDWTATGRQIDGHIEFQVDVSEKASAQQIKEAILANPKATAQVAIPSGTLRSGKKDMDKKMFDALRTKQHPEITYRLAGVKVIGKGDGKRNSFQLQTTGELTIAGTTRTLDMPMTVEVLDERQLKISGRTPIRMSDFKVQPPQAMGGVIKAGDKVTVEVEWRLASSPRAAAVTKK